MKIFDLFAAVTIASLIFYVLRLNFGKEKMKRRKEVKKCI